MTNSSNLLHQDNVGRHPDDVTLAEYQQADVPLPTAMKAIREKCLDCCADQPSEVRKCVSTDCPLWTLRMGKYPKARRELKDV